MTYEEWLNVEELSYKLVSPSFVRGVMDSTGCYEFLMDLTTESARAFQDEMNHGQGFNFDPDNDVAVYVRTIVESWIVKHVNTYPDGADPEKTLSYGERIQDSYDAILAKATEGTKKPNEGKSLLQYNQSQNIYTAIERPFSTEIKLQVTGCEEKCPAVVYGLSDDYDEPQNLGCAAYGKNKFVFDLSRAKKFPMIEIRFPYEGVEVI